MAIAPIATPAVNGASAPVPLRLGAGAAVSFATLLEDELLHSPAAAAPMPPSPPVMPDAPVVIVPGLVPGYMPVWTARESAAKRPPDKKKRPPKRQ